ncbi:FHA domain-containing protein [Yinghuangia soli]|uniref:FHA domain-containing protein n=1 Tax=Yinghuangia soli TaxID=2908204 RepID=UPI0027E318B1|nr:FHA domain-containing protein [Yinghuangia soli]
MKLFARLFGRSRRTEQEAPQAPAGGPYPGPAQGAPGAVPPGPAYGAPDPRSAPDLSESTQSFPAFGAAVAAADPGTVVCGNCGNTNPAAGRFCSYCGNPLRPDVERPSEQTSTISITGIEALDAEPAPREVLSPEAQAAVEALPPGTALLVVRRGPNSGSRFLLDSDRTTAGRHPESDIFLDDVTVSRRHAEFRRSASGFTVADVGSLNGTYVGRQRIDEVPLTAGDEVQIGKYRLVFFPSRHAQIGSGEHA